jgi:hypothetical protein
MAEENNKPGGGVAGGGAITAPAEASGISSSFVVPTRLPPADAPPRAWKSTGAGPGWFSSDWDTTRRIPGMEAAFIMMMVVSLKSELDRPLLCLLESRITEKYERNKRRKEFIAKQ